MMISKINGNFAKSALGIAIIFLSLLAYASNTNRFFVQRWDDAYITFRFADHLANGQGLIWNVGGERVEGFTSFFHVLLLAAGSAAGLGPWWTSLGISIACVLFVTAILLVLIWKQTGTIHPFAAILIGAYLIDPVTAIHTTSGLETQLYVAALVGTLYLALSFTSSPRFSVSLGIGLLIFLSTTTRPEAVIFGFGLYLVLGVYCLAKNDHRNEYLLKLSSSIGLLVFLGTIYVIWKLNYFGYLFPNPFYVKSNRFSFSGLSEVGGYVKHLFRWVFPPAAAIILVYLLKDLWSGRKSDGGRVKNRLKEVIPTLVQGDFKYGLFAVLMPALLSLAFYTTIIHEVGGAYRFSYPTYVLFVLAVSSVIALLASRIKVSTTLEYLLIFIALAWYGSLVVSLKSWTQPRLPDSAFNQYHLKIAEALKSTDLGAKGTILCDAAGIIPYVSGFSQVDRVGLADNFLSGRTPATMLEREAYIWSRPLDVYLGADPPATTSAARAEDDPRMNTPYVSDILLKRRLSLVESRVYPKDPEILHARMRELRDHWLFIGEVEWPAWKFDKMKNFLYVRKDSPNAALLVSKLEPLVKNRGDQVDYDNF